MKKLTLLVIISFLFISVSAQKALRLNEYKALNGKVYRVGDSLKLGRGSGNNGSFVYVTFNTLGYALTNSNAYVGAPYAGAIVNIKKIKKYAYKHYKGVYFTVSAGTISNLIIKIEDAIATGEVITGNKKQSAVSTEDKYDKLIKLKKLLDNGVLTKEEYETEKAKILNEKNR